MVADYWAMASAVVSAAICVRILLHQRETHTFKAAIGAYLIAMGAGCHSLTLLLSVAKGQPGTTTPYSLILLCVVAYQLFRSGGDAARLFRAGMD